MNTIPAGYALHVTTWENDADNFKTVKMEGLTKEQAKMYYQMCLFFKNGTNNGGVGTDGRGNYGNATVRCSSHGKQRCSVHFNPERFVEEFKAFCKDQKPQYEGFEEDFHEHSVYNLVGYWYEDCYVRVFESATLYYYPQDVVSLDLEVELKLGE